MKMMELDEKIEYPDAIFYLGDMLKREEQYEEAANYFSFYREVCEDKSKLLVERDFNEDYKFKNREKRKRKYSISKTIKSFGAVN